MTSPEKATHKDPHKKPTSVYIPRDVEGTTQKNKNHENAKQWNLKKKPLSSKILLLKGIKYNRIL